MLSIILNCLWFLLFSKKNSFFNLIVVNVCNLWNLFCRSFNFLFLNFLKVLFIKE